MHPLSTPEGVATRFEDAWNAHDMALFATVFEPEATFVNRFATMWRGVDDIVAGHRLIHETVYRDSTLRVDPPEVARLADDIAVLHLWTRLTAGDAHPAGAHQVDTLILAVVTRRSGAWRIRAAENVALADPRSGRTVLRQS